MSVAPGWYRDPAAPETQRYWDGEQWLGEPISAEATPPATPPTAPPAAPPTPARSVETPSRPAHAAPSGPVRTMPERYGAPPPGYPRTWPPTLPEPTPQGYQLAPPGLRLWARLIDIAAVGLLTLLANSYFLYQYMKVAGPWSREFMRWWAAGAQGTPPAQPSQISTLVIAMMLVLLAVWFAYEVPAVANEGATPGKRLVGLRVVRLDGVEKVGFPRSVRRWSSMAIPTLLWYCCVGFILQFADAAACLIDRPYRQCVHDKAVGTVVVRTAGRRTETETREDAR